MVSIQEWLRNKIDSEAELGLQTLFTPWQIAIIKKRMEGQELTAAESQEMSRRIKAKVIAIQSLQGLHWILPPFK